MASTFPHLIVPPSLCYFYRLWSVSFIADSLRTYTYAIPTIHTQTLFYLPFSNLYPCERYTRPVPVLSYLTWRISVYVSEFIVSFQITLILVLPY